MRSNPSAQIRRFRIRSALDEVRTVGEELNPAEASRARQNGKLKGKIFNIALLASYSARTIELKQNFIGFCTLHEAKILCSNLYPKYRMAN